jgi:hypothetical protein
VALQRFAYSHLRVRFEPIVIAPAKIRKQPKHVDLSDQRKEPVQGPGLFWELRLQSVEVDREISGHGKARSVRKMKMVDRIHLDPSVSNAEIVQQSSSDSRRISKQRVKMCCRIERIALAAEGAAISANHVVLLGEQNPQSFTRQQVRADQTTDARADNHGVIGIVGRPVSQTPE